VTERVQANRPNNPDLQCSWPDERPHDALAPIGTLAASGGTREYPVSVASSAFQPVDFSYVLHFWSTTTLVVINTTKARLCPLSDGATLRPMSIRQKPGLVAIVDDDESLQRALQDLIESDGLPARCRRPIAMSTASSKHCRLKS
jgi:hypothetical protein